MYKIYLMCSFEGAVNSCYLRGFIASFLLSSIYILCRLESFNNIVIYNNISN